VTLSCNALKLRFFRIGDVTEEAIMKGNSKRLSDWKGISKV
jgi:hypothetical protein